MCSYGVVMEPNATDYLALSARLAVAMPTAQRASSPRCRFRSGSATTSSATPAFGPVCPWTGKTQDDLIWIRDPFLRDPRDHGVVVVHGHTPVTAPEVRANRIDIDTGAVYGGPLTCLVLEGANHRFLSVPPS